MATSTLPFWRRIGGALKFGANPGGAFPLTLDAPAKTPEALRDAPATSAFRWPWSARRAALQERHARLNHLLGALREHFAARERHDQRLNTAVEQVASTLERVVAAQQSQSESLAGISRQLQAAGQHAALVSGALQELPAAMQAQAEAVHGVGKQLEASRGANTALGDSLRGLGAAVELLRRSSDSQSDALHALAQHDAAQREALQAFMRDQHRRVTIVTVALSVLSVGAAAALITAIVLVAFH